MTYRIVRKYRENHPDHNKVIDTGLTLEQAQAHCNDPATSEKGVWFDCYYEEGYRRESQPPAIGAVLRRLHAEKH
jgi:hypothetical protein